MMISRIRNYPGLSLWTRMIGLLMFLAIVSAPLQGQQRSLVRIETNYGDITAELYDGDAPLTVDNFLGYVSEGFYQGLIFHRVVEDFVIQAGAYEMTLYDADFSDPGFDLRDPNYWREPGDPIALETTAGLKNLRGTLAMARQSQPDTATSQFFINTVDNASLDPSDSKDGYAVFGEVVEGMSVVDDIEQVAVIEDSEVTDSFQNLPIREQACAIESVELLRQYDLDSSDFSGVPFLGASAGVVRTFIGRGDFEPLTYRHVFSDVTVRGITVLRWKQQAESLTGVASIVCDMARDDQGGLWVLSYSVKRPGQSVEQVVEAETLAEAVAFEAMGDQDMQFRLMAGLYNPADLDDPANSITFGPLSRQVTQEIVSVTASLPPRYPDEELVLVKETIRDGSSVEDVNWRYYHHDDGLVLDLDDDFGNTDGNGWWLSTIAFDETSDDFSMVDYLRVPQEESAYVRTYVGQGRYEDNNFTHSFSRPETTYSGVSVLRWEQTALTNTDIDAFQLDMARDAQGELWVFYYERNDEILIDANSPLEAEPFDTIIEDEPLFRLIAGDYAVGGVYDWQQGATSWQCHVVTDQATVGHVPHYRGQLVQLRCWSGVSENNNHLSWYHPSVGLVLTLRDGGTGPEGDGWRLAFYGGRFDDSSDDFSEVPFLKVGTGTTRQYVGQGDFEAEPLTHTFAARSMNTLDCVRWSRSRISDAVEPFFLYIARDTLGVCWVFRYSRDGETVFEVGDDAEDRFKAVPLSRFADDDIWFRLIAGEYNSSDLEDPCNISRRGSGDDEVVESVTDFDQGLSTLPAMNDGAVVVKRENTGVGTTDWLVYHPEVGLMLEYRSQGGTQPSLPNANLTGWRLGWYGRNRPSFDGDSDDFSDTDFVAARAGAVREYLGQGDFAGSSFQQRYATEVMHGINGLLVTETEDRSAVKAARSLLLARDTSGGVWVMKETVDSHTLFSALAEDQLVPAGLYPELWLRLIAGQDELYTTVNTGEPGLTRTEKIISVDEALAGPDSYDEDLVLVATEPPAGDCDFFWDYFHPSAGLVLSLLEDRCGMGTPDPNVFDPELLDPEQADGWLLAEGDDFDELTIMAIPGASREQSSDFLRLSGQGPFDPNDLDTESVFLQVGPWSMEMSGSQLRQVGEMLMYHGSPDGRSQVSFTMNATTGRVSLVASQVNLTGLMGPVMCHMTLGGRVIEGEAETHNGMPLSVVFLEGVRDALAVSTFRYATNRPAQPYNETLMVMGSIVFQEPDPNIAGKRMAIQWGTQAEQAIPADSDDGLKQLGSSQLFFFQRTSSQSIKVVYALFDLRNHRFVLSMDQAGDLSFPLDLKVKVTTASGHRYNETARLVVTY